MELIANVRAVRAKGTLDVELEDGRTATLEVNVDLSDFAEWGVDREYDDDDTLGRCCLRIVRPKSETWYLRLRNPRQEEPLFTLHVPVDDS